MWETLTAREHPFPPLPSSSLLFSIPSQRLCFVGRERDAIAGKGSPGLLKSIFRGEQGRLGGRDVDILWPSGHRSRPFSLQTNTSLFKPMSFYTGSGACWEPAAGLFEGRQPSAFSELPFGLCSSKQGLEAWASFRVFVQQ